MTSSSGSIAHCAGDRRPGHLSQRVSLVRFQLPLGVRSRDPAEPEQFRLELANGEAHDERGDHDRRPRAGQDRPEGRSFARRLGLCASPRPPGNPPPRELIRPHRRVGVRREHKPSDKRRGRPLRRPLWPRERGRPCTPASRGHAVDAPLRPALVESPFDRPGLDTAVEVGGRPNGPGVGQLAGRVVDRRARPARPVADLAPFELLIHPVDVQGTPEGAPVARSWPSG